MHDKNIETLASVIQKGVNNRLKDLHTNMPGIIVSFDGTTQSASIQPAIKRLFKTDDGEKEITVPVDLPILINVPIIFPRGGGFSLTFPVAPGDECLITFCERGIDNWRKLSGVQNPIAKRFHHLSDATAFVGLSSSPNVIPSFSTTDVVIKKDDGSVSIILKPDGNVELNADVKVTTTAPTVDIIASAAVNITSPLTTVNGALTVTGVTTLGAIVTSNGKDISDTHLHLPGAYNITTTPVTGNSGTPV